MRFAAALVAVRHVGQALTDSMYDPKAKPHVSHDQGTELVIQHSEQYWAPTALSTDLMRAWGR